MAITFHTVNKFVNINLCRYIVFGLVTMSLSKLDIFRIYNELKDEFTIHNKKLKIF